MKNEATIDGVTVAGQPTDDELRDLKRRGYAAVINVRMPQELDEPEESKITGQGLTYAEVGFTGATLNSEHVRGVREAIDAAGGPVLLH